MNNRKRLTLIGLTAAACIALDQITKYVAVQTIMFSPSREYLGGFFVLKYAENTGAMLGFGASLPENMRFWFLTVFVGVMLVGLVSYLVLHRGFTTMQTVALSLIAGGGISNFIDRAINNGRVVDFMHFDTGYGWLKTGIFNFADVSIMIGLAIMIIWGNWKHEQDDKGKPSEHSADNADVASGRIEKNTD